MDTFHPQAHEEFLRISYSMFNEMSVTYLIAHLEALKTEYFIFDINGYNMKTP